MSMKWGNDPESPKPIRNDSKREGDGSALFFAALGVSLVYALVLGGGAWLRTFVKKNHPIQATEANPVPVSVTKTK